MTKVNKIIGIDISKEKFDACFSFQPYGYSSRTYTYNEEGIRSFLTEVPSDCICIMEATGVYHLRLAYALTKAAIYVSVVNPLSVKNFSRAVMCRTKTDKADARQLVDYARRMELVEWKPTSENYIRIQQIYRTIELFVTNITQLENQLEAISNFKKAIELDENIAEAYAGLGFIFCEEENHKSAIKFLKRAHELAPFNTDYLFVLVEENNKLGKYKNSIKYLKEIEELYPFDVNLYIAFMEVYIMQDDIDNAVKYIEKGLNKLGKQAPLLYRLAFINFIQEEEQLGLMNLEEALEIDTDGVQEFIDFDPNYILNNENIVNLINEYKNKNNNPF